MERRQNDSWPQILLLASPRGFCAGVRRAIDILNEVQLQNPHRPVSSYHEIIHNTHVVSQFEQKGVQFVNEVSEAQEGGIMVWSAHGVAPEIMAETHQRGLEGVDATCPLVAKTHTEALRYIAAGFSIIYIGHAGHDETVGTLGYAPESTHLVQTLEDAQTIAINDPEKIALITQTTLSQDETEEIKETLRQRFPKIEEPKKEDICYATQNRQDGVKKIVEMGAEVVVTVGSQNSSNSRRLKEVTEAQGARGILIDDASELDPSVFFGVNCVGLTAGASAPDDKFQEVVEWFKTRGSINIEEVIVANESQTNFTLPIQLRKL